MEVLFAGFSVSTGTPPSIDFCFIPVFPIFASDGTKHEGLIHKRSTIESHLYGRSVRVIEEKLFTEFRTLRVALL